MPDNDQKPIGPKPIIKYVCISDIHLGAKDSVLTHIDQATGLPDTSKNGEVLVNLVDCLRQIITRANGTDSDTGIKDKPILILMGDILEMSLSSVKISAACFEKFIELIMPPNKNDRLFDDKIVYIPGNHDHLLWDSAKDTQYVDHIAKNPGESLPDQWHTTNLFIDIDAKNSGDRKPVPAYFLNTLIDRVLAGNANYLKPITINIVYPNLGFVRNGADGRHVVVITHGHYVEWIYSIMSILIGMIFPNAKPPKEIWTLEKENFNWINFFWSSLGDTGRVATDFELIYDKLQNPKQTDMLVKELSKSLANKLLSNHPILNKLVSDKLVPYLIVSVLDLLRNKFAGTEKGITDKLLTGNAEKGLVDYINGPLLDHANREIPGFEYESGKFTFIFGHTHKPFSLQKSLPNNVKYDVYNTGGWVVDTEESAPTHGGAVVLLDNDLNPVSLRMYNENNYVITVETASKNQTDQTPFFTKIKNIIDNVPQQDVDKPFDCGAFSDSMSTTVPQRREKFIQRVNKVTGVKS